MNHGKQCGSVMKVQGIVHNKDVIHKACQWILSIVGLTTFVLPFEHLGFTIYISWQCVAERKKSSVSERWSLDRVVPTRLPARWPGPFYSWMVSKD